ncbi:MAG: flavin reductase family protein [Eubacteriales bacterium]|nr:flavin reductase family protein [Eubacteriales bacterium]
MEEKKTVKKAVWKPGTMVYPLPAVMVSCADKAGNANILTVAWTGTICSEPPMAYISVRPERFSHHMIEETGEFVINLTTEALCAATDFCGVRSGAKLDKWKECGLTKQQGSVVAAPLIAESPVNIECKVTQVLKLGSHDMFIAKVEAVDVDESYMDEKGRFDMDRCGLIAYNHGEYHRLGSLLGTFGYTVKKK